MDARDREQIDLYCDEILPKINMSRLWPCLIEFGVFNADDGNASTWEATLDAPATVRDILQSIKSRGPNAFQNFLRSLRTTDHKTVADILDYRKNTLINNNNPSRVNTLPNAGISQDLPSTDDGYHMNIRISQEPLQIAVRKSTEFLDTPELRTIGRYRMRTKPRGYVLIITIIKYMLEAERDGAEHDETNLKKLFSDMGFEVTARNNLTGAEIMQVVKEFSEQKDFNKVSSCFVIISGHGTETTKNGLTDTEIHGVDYNLSTASKVYCNDIVDFFVADKCKQLSGKPKVFIFQACRIKPSQELVDRTAADGNDPRRTIRKYSDILIAHSTMPGYFAYRDNITGSWYIQILCEVFMNHAWELHVQDLFNMVDRRLMKLQTTDNKSQTSTIKLIGFNMHCFLNPGLFEEP